MTLDVCVAVGNVSGETTRYDNEHGVKGGGGGVDATQRSSTPPNPNPTPLLLDDYGLLLGREAEKSWMFSPPSVGIISSVS